MVTKAVVKITVYLIVVMLRFTYYQVMANITLYSTQSWILLNVIEATYMNSVIIYLFY